MAATKKKTPAPKKPAPAKPAKPKKAAAAKPFITTDREEAYRHFAPLVATIAEGAIEPWHHDAELVRVNVERAVHALGPHLDGAAAKLKHIDVDAVRELPALALALAFVDARIFTPASAQEIREAQLRQRPRRRLALMQLVVLREMGLLADGAKVDAIVPGRGGIDEAQDGVACVAVFRENAAKIAGKHPFDEAWLQALADDSNWLLAQLNPKGVKKSKAPRSAEALTRDQLFAEIVRRYGEAKKIAVEVWGWKNVDDHFPALLSREVTKPSAPAPARPAPVTP